MRRLAVATVLALSAPAFADPATDRALANDHSRHGVALYETGRYQDALVEFEQAYVLYPTGSGEARARSRGAVSRVT